MFDDDVMAETYAIYDEGHKEGYSAGLKYAIDLLKSEAAEKWRQDKMRITCAQPTAQRLDLIVKVLEKEQSNG